MQRRLTKSSTDCSLEGVLGGIAEFLGWSSFRIRLTFVVLLVVSGFVPGIIAYVLLCFLMPMPNQEADTTFHFGR